MVPPPKIAKIVETSHHIFCEQNIAPPPSKMLKFLFTTHKNRFFFVSYTNSVTVFVNQLWPPSLLKLHTKLCNPTLPGNYENALPLLKILEITLP